MATFTWPANGGTNGVQVFATFADFLPGTFVGELAIAADTGTLYEWNGTSWAAIASPGAALGVGTFDSTTPSPNGGVITGNQLIFQSASTSDPGLVNNSTQSFSGDKTFTGNVAFDGTFTFPTQSDNVVFAGPSSGPASAPTFRALVNSDVSTLTVANISGTSNSTLETLSVLSLPTTQLSGNVALTQIAPIASDTILGNNTGSSGNPIALTPAQVNAILPVFTSSLNGLAPLSGGGTTNFLRADGSWAAPPASSGTVTSVSVISANGFAGTVATDTTTPAITLTTSVTAPVLAGSGTALIAATTTGTGSTVVLATGPIVDLTNATGLPLTSGVTGVLPLANGGTAHSTAATAFAALSPLTTAGDLLYESATPAPARLPIGSTNQVLAVVSGLPSWKTPVAPSFSFLETVSSPVGYLFTLNSTQTLVAGDTYLNNLVTFTVLNSGATTLLFSSSSGAPTLPSGGLVRTSGSGPSTLSYVQVTALGSYSVPSGALYLFVRMVGAGGGGAGSSSQSANNGGAGQTGSASVFGLNLLIANGGVGPGGGQSAPGGSGGSGSIASGPVGIVLNGSSGSASSFSQVSSAAFFSGGTGGSSPFGGSGAGGAANGAASGIGVPNTGSGGGGGGSPTTGICGSGGGSGGYIEATISSPSSTYLYSIGVGGVAGTAGSSGTAGAAGGSGLVIVTAYYQ